MYQQFFNTRELRPGGNVGFDGGIIDRNRKIKGIKPFIIKQLREAYSNYINMGKTHIEAVKRLGNTCNQIKQDIPHGKFKSVLKLHLPYVSMSTIERAMKIDKFIDFDSFPIFKLVPQSHLLKLSKIYSLETILDILNDNNISLVINENNTEAVGVFLGCIKQLAHGQMGFLTITEDEEKAESIIDSGGWQDLQVTMDTRPDTKIEVTTTVNSTEYILEKYSVFVKTLGQCRGDIGDTLDVETTFALISNVIAVVETLQLVGPSNLTNETRMKQPLDFFNKILNELMVLDVEQDNTVDLDGDDYIRRKQITLKQRSIKHTNIKAINNSNDVLLHGDIDGPDIEEDEDLIQILPKEKRAIEKAGSKKRSVKNDDNELDDNELDDNELDDNELEGDNQDDEDDYDDDEDDDEDDDDDDDDDDGEPKKKGKSKSKSKSKGKSSKDDDDLDLDDDDLDLDDDDDEPPKQGKSKSKGNSKKVEDDDGDEDDDDLDLDDDDDEDEPPKKGKIKSKSKSKGKARKAEDDDDDDDLDDDELEEKKKQNISKKKLTSKKSRGKFGKTSAIQDDEDLFNDIFGEED